MKIFFKNNLKKLIIKNKKNIFQKKILAKFFLLHFRASINPDHHFSW